MVPKIGCQLPSDHVCILPLYKSFVVFQNQFLIIVDGHFCTIPRIIRATLFFHEHTSMRLRGSRSIPGSTRPKIRVMVLRVGIEPALTGRLRNRRSGGFVNGFDGDHVFQSFFAGRFGFLVIAHTVGKVVSFQRKHVRMLAGALLVNAPPGGESL